MKRCLLILALTLPLQGCFFIVIPHEITDGMHDAITGERGDNCVGASVKVGDRVNLPGGIIGTVKELSGKSSRCREADKPIRATIAH